MQARLPNPPNRSVGLTQILIVSQQPKISEPIESALAQQGYQVETINLDWLRFRTSCSIQPDLIILALQFDLPSLDLCRRLRLMMERVPIILLSTACELDLILGFEAGADDCMIQPFTIEALLVRIRVRLRYAQKEKPLIWGISQLTLDCQKRKVYWSNLEIQLTAKEFDLLKYLMSHYQQTVSRHELWENLWGTDYKGDSNVIDAYICRLRSKLETHSQLRLIQTIYGVGYILRDPDSSCQDAACFAA
jgi:DNA-binding response OmpR family regulator